MIAACASSSLMSAAENLSEQVREAADRIVESGPAALTGLFDLTSQRLLRYSLSITRNQHDAEDAVQGALVRVAERPSRLSRSEQPWPYLLRMVRNESLLILRRRKRWSSLASLADLLTRVGVDEAEMEETYREVWRSLRTLPVEQSEVVVLKIWESMTFAEIAGVLEVSASTAASRYRYAMEKLSRRLGGLAGTPSTVDAPSLALRNSGVSHGD